MTKTKPRSLHFTIGGALLAIGASTTPYDQGCSLERAVEEEAGIESIAPPQRSREPDRVPIVVNPGPVAMPLPVTAREPRDPPIVVNPGPVPPPDDQD
jgi:hypothetical protein